MSETPATDYEDLWYIKTSGPGDKKPKERWGGYSQDFEDAENVYTHEEADMLPETNWAICGLQDIESPRASRALLVFDLDIHKADEDFDPDDLSVPSNTLIVKSQSGGFHIYFMLLNTERGEGRERDFELTQEISFDIDIRGSYVSHHVVAPQEIPGITGEYTIVNDEPINTVLDPADAAERIRYKGEPLLTHRPNSGGRPSDYNRDEEAPEEMPTCYHAGLELRKSAPEAAWYNAHKVNTLTALCGLAAGYDVDTVVEHFIDDYPPGGKASNNDRQKTEYHVEHMAEKMDRGALAPPSISTLQDWGILEETETCACGIEYHGSNEDAGRQMSDEEMWEWWSEARTSGELTESSVIPTPALRHIAKEQEFYNFDELDDDVERLPAKANNKALYWLENVWAEEQGFADDEEATARSYMARDPDRATTWEDIRYVYEESNQDGRYAAVNRLRSNHHFLAPMDQDTLYIYDPDLGYYTEDGAQKVGDILDDRLGRHYSQHEKNEIVSRLQENRVHREHFNAGEEDAPLVCVQNGVLNVHTGELLEHSPDYHFTKALPVEYDEDAEAVAIKEFINEITDQEDQAKTLIEFIGHTLLQEYDPQGFLVLFGEGENGKSIYFHVVQQFLEGDDPHLSNYSGVPIQKLSENRFATSSLVNKMANIAPDMPQVKVDELGDIKTLTGGEDPVEAERKRQDAFTFINSATLMFGANRPPLLGEVSHAVKRRLYPIRLPYRFVDNPEGPREKKAKNKDELKEELTTDEELSGLLNLALEGIQRLREDGFSLDMDAEERLEYYQQYSDPIKQFAVNCLENEPEEDVYVTKDAVYDAYKGFCAANDHSVASKNVFFRQLRQTTFTYTDYRPEIEPGAREPSLKSAQLTEQGFSYLSDAMMIPYHGVVEDPTEDVDTDSKEASGNAPEPVALGEIDEQKQDRATVIGEIEFRKWEGTNPDEKGPDWSATLEDETGEAELVIWDGRPDSMYDSKGAFRPDTLLVKDARVGWDEYDDRLQLVVDEKTEISKAQLGAGHTSMADPGEDETVDATTDGGQEVVQLKERIQNVLSDKSVEQPITPTSVAATLQDAGVDIHPVEDEDALKQALDSLANRKRPMITGAGEKEGYYRYVDSLPND